MEVGSTLKPVLLMLIKTKTYFSNWNKLDENNARLIIFIICK